MYILKSYSLVVALLVTLAVPRSLFAAQEDERYRIATKAFADGFYEAGISLFQRFIEEFPKSDMVAEAKLYIAKCYYFQEDYPRALRTLRSVIDDPKAAAFRDESYYWLGEVSFKGKNFTESLNLARRVIQEYPQSAFQWWAQQLAGNSYLALGMHQEAQEAFTRIITANKIPEVVEGSYEQLLNFYFQEKQHDSLIRLGEQYLKDYPWGNLKAKVYFYLGDGYYAKKQFEEAKTNYNRCIELTKESEVRDLARQGVALVVLAQGDEQGAKQIIDEIKDRELRLFSQGVYYFNVKRYPQALDTYSLFIHEFPKSTFLPSVYLHQADTLYELGRINDSLSVYTFILGEFKGAQQSDVRDKAYYGLAWCHLKNGEFKRAIDEFKNTLRYTENPIVKVSSQIQIADAYQESGDYSQAIDMYNDILRQNADTVYDDYIQFQIGMVFLKMGHLEEALLALRNLKKQFPDSALLPEAQYYLAAGYFTQEAYAEAQSLLEDFMERFSSNQLLAKVYYLYGKCFFNQGQYTKALEIFTEMISNFKDQQDIRELVYIDMGNAYINVGSLDKAKEIWKEFLRKFPHSSYAGSVQIYLGSLHEREGDWAQAISAYRNVIEDQPKSTWAHEALFSLGHLYMQRQDYQHATEAFSQLASVDDQLSLKAQLYLAKLSVLKGDNQKALAQYDILIGSDSPFGRIALLEKALLLKETKAYAKAIPLLQKAIAQDLDSPRLRFALGICYEKMKKSKEAIEQYLKIAYTDYSASGEDVQQYRVKAYFRVAKIYEEDGNLKAAKEVYRKLTEFDVTEARIAAARLKELEKQE